MKVLHLLRKNSQLKASFILNQLSNHREYKPLVAFYEDRSKVSDIGFASPEGTDIEILSLDSKPSFFAILRYKLLKLISRKAKRQLLNLIKEQAPNVIHLHYGTDAGLYLPLLSKLGLPTIVSFYGYDSYSFPRKFFGLGGFFLRVRVFRHADYLLAMTEEMKSDLIKAGCPNEKIIVHYHGVPETLANIERDYKMGPECNLMMLSYLDPVKGHLFALKALNKLVEKGVINFRLRIYGDGHYRKEIEAKIIELKLRGMVTLEGSLQYLSKPFLKAFEEADIFLHPSVKTRNDKEGVPGAMVESMFSGLPTIATFHGGIPYVIKNNSTGILVEENDEIALSDAIHKLMMQSVLRKSLGTRAREYALKNLVLVKRQEVLESIYNKCLKN